MLCPKCGSPVSGLSGSCPQCTPSPALEQPNQDSRPSSSASPASPASPETDVKAILSLLLGVLSIVPLSIFAGIPAVVLGHISRASVRRSAGRLKGGGIALAGLTMGYVSLAIVPFVLIAGIAIPSLFRDRIAVNEASALNTLRSINFAATNYQVEHKVYPASLQELAPTSLFPLDEAVTSLGTQSGYRFTYKSSSSGSGYVLRADPISLATGQRHFYSDSTGIIRFEKNRPANALSSSLGLGP